MLSPLSAASAFELLAWSPPGWGATLVYGLWNTIIIALGAWLIPKLGILGAAIGTTCSYSVAALLLYGFFLRESGLAWYEPLILNGEDISRLRRLAAEVGKRRPGKNKGNQKRD